MSYVRDQFRGHVEILDEWSTGVDEEAIMISPPRAGVVANRVPVRGFFRVSEVTDDNLTIHGVNSSLNGVFFMRRAFIPELLDSIVHDGTLDPRAGWRMEIRGREMRVVRMTLQGGGVAIMVRDLLGEA